MHFFNSHGEREYLMSAKNKYNYNIIRGPFPCKHSDLLVSLHPWNKKHKSSFIPQSVKELGSFL